MYVRHRKIKEETEDRIVVTDSTLTIGCVLGGLFIIILGLYCVGLGVVISYFAIVAERGGWFFAIIGLFVILSYGYDMLEMLQELLAKKSVIIDRKRQNVIIGGDSLIKYLKSIKRISFADIEYIKIRIDIEDGISTGHRAISLITIHGNEVEIFDGDYAPTEKLAKNICTITGKQIARENNRYSPLNV